MELIYLELFGAFCILFLTAHRDAISTREQNESWLSEPLMGGEGGTESQPDRPQQDRAEAALNLFPKGGVSLGGWVAHRPNRDTMRPNASRSNVRHSW